MPPALPEEEELELLPVDELELPPVEVLELPAEPPPEMVIAPPFPPDDDEDPPLEDEEALGPPVLDEMVETGIQTIPLRVNPPMQAIHCPLSKL